MYCPGIPEAGKTITSALIMEQIRKSDLKVTALAYIFCQYQQGSTTNMQSVSARSMLRMLMEHLEIVPEEVTQCYDEGQNLNVDQLLTLLKVATIYCRATIIVDALDELDLKPRNKLL